MKPWFRLTLVVCVLPCLLLNLTQAVALNHPLQVVDSGSWLDRGREPASHAPPVSVVRSTAFDSDRAGPRQSLVLDGVLTAVDLAPPGPESHGPPEHMSPWQVAGQANHSNQHHRATLSTKLLAFNRPNSRIAVLQQPLASYVLRVAGLLGRAGGYFSVWAGAQNQSVKGIKHNGW